MENYVVEGKLTFHNVGTFHLPRGDEVSKTLGKSIKKARLEAKLTQQQLADKLGLSRPTVTQWESGTTTPNARKLEELAKALGLSESALFAEEQGVNVRDGPGTARWVPEVSWVQAGAWTEVIDVVEDLSEAAHWPCPVVCSQGTFCLRVEGDSMSPDYPPGTLIYVDPEVVPTPGRRVVAMCDGWQKATFKQFVVDGDNRYLKAINPDWPQQYMELSADCRIIGTVIFSGRED